MKRFKLGLVAVLASVAVIGTAVACQHDGADDVVVQYDVDSTDPTVKMILRIGRDDSARLTYLGTADEKRALSPGTAERLVETLLANGFKDLHATYDHGAAPGGPTIGLLLNTRGVNKSVRAVGDDIEAKDVYLIAREITRIVGLQPWREEVAKAHGVNLGAVPTSRPGK